MKKNKKAKKRKKSFQRIHEKKLLDLVENSNFFINKR
jgi:hypothetical protein